MQFRLLGPVEIETHDGRVLTPPRRRERCLLAVLLLEPGQVVPAHRLSDLLWEDTPAEPTRRALYGHVARVRATLATAGAEADGVALVSHGGGYLLRVEPDLVDVHQFRGLVDRATRATEVSQRDKLLHDALALWRGPALHNTATGGLRDRLCAELDELRLHAIEEFMATGLALGRHRELVPELARLTLAHPLRSRLVRLHMLALHHGGRSADALDAYHRARVHLAEELGLDPDPELQRLHRAMLRGGSVPASDVATAKPVLTAAPVVPAQLPLDTAGFTGRDLELGILDGLLGADHESPAGVAVCVIAGTAGVGKTALAVHWAHHIAHRFPDGQLYINLRGFGPCGSAMHPAEAIRTFLDAFNVPPQRISSNLDSQIGLYRSMLSGKHILVVLDNARDAEQIRPLLPGTPGCLAVVTSRHHLAALAATEAAHPITLDLLAHTEARDLLTRRLGSSRVTAEPYAVDELITLSARLPLALAIAAARAVTRPTQPLAALAGQLRQAANQLDAFDSGDPYTNLRAVFSWSYHALPVDAARMFRLLGLHPGPDISIPAAASLAGVPVLAAQDLLDQLEDAHLVAQHANGRCALHDLLRAYATELASTVDTDDDRYRARHRMLDHYLHTAFAATLLLQPTRRLVEPLRAFPGVRPEKPADAKQAWAWFVAEHRVLLAAVERAAQAGFDTHVWRLAWALFTFLDRYGNWRDLVPVQQAAVAAGQHLSDVEVQARAQWTLSSAHIRLGQHDDALANLRSALSLYRAIGEVYGQANVHSTLARLFERQGDLRRGLRHARQALLMYPMDHPSGRARSLNMMGWFHAHLGHTNQALAECHEALSIQQKIGDKQGQALTWDSLGYAHHRLGDRAQAVACYQQAIGFYRDLSDRYNEADTLTRLGDTHHDVGDREAAAEAWKHALNILDELAHPDTDQVRVKLHELQ